MELALVAGASVALSACGQVAHGGGSGSLDPAGPPIVIGASLGITGGLSGNIARARGRAGGGLSADQRGGGDPRASEVQFLIKDDQSNPMVAPTTLREPRLRRGAGRHRSGASSEVTADLASVRGARRHGAGPGHRYLADRDVDPPHGEAGRGKARVVLPYRPQRRLPGQGRGAVRAARPGGGDAGTGCRNMAIVYQMDQYGMPMDQIVEQAFKTGGGNVVLSIGVPATAAQSYATQAAQIVAKNPGTGDYCMAMIVFTPTGAQLVTDVTNAVNADRATNPTHWANWFIVGTDACYEPAFITDARSSPTSPSIVNGVYGTNADSAPSSPEYGDLQSLYYQTVGLRSDQKDLDPYTSNAYDAAILVALAIQAAGGLADPVRNPRSDVRRVERALADGVRLHAQADPRSPRGAPARAGHQLQRRVGDGRLHRVGRRPRGVHRLEGGEQRLHDLRSHHRRATRSVMGST